MNKNEQNYTAMIATLANLRFLDAKAEGDHSGDWIAEPKYKLNVVPHNTDRSKAAFQVIGILNMDFANGGSFEYICEALYELNNVDHIPGRNALVALVYYEVPKLFERLFEESKAVSNKRKETTIWIPYSKERIEYLVDQTLLNYRL